MSCVACSTEVSQSAETVVGTAVMKKWHVKRPGGGNKGKNAGVWGRVFQKKEAMNAKVLEGQPMCLWGSQEPVSVAGIGERWQNHLWCTGPTQPCSG